MNNVVVEDSRVRNYPLRRSFTGFLSLFYLILVSTLILAPIGLVVGVGQSFFVSALIVTVVAELIVVVLGLKFNGQLDRWREVLGFKNFSVKSLLFGGFVGVGLFFGLQFLAVFVESLGLNVSSSDTSESLLGLVGPVKFLVLFIISPLVVPVVEEVFFRGLIMGSFLESSFKGKSRVVLAVVVSSFMFSIAHFQGAESFNDFMLLGWIFVLALVSSFMRLRFDSIYPSMFLHVVYNSVTVIVGLLLFS